MSRIEYLDDNHLKQLFPDGKVNSTELVVIDVRAPMEAAVERIAGSVNIPLEALPHIDKNAYQDKTVVFHCKGGVRTRANQPLLESLKSKNSYCMAGGIEQWKKCGNQVMSK